MLPGLIAATAIGPPLRAQLPELPAGARSQWRVERPFEVVGYVVFDPTELAAMLPSGLRFVTVSEVAAQGIPWAAAFLARHETEASWGISFVELLRAGTFDIDGRRPEWGEEGAIGLWFARVAPAAQDGLDLGRGTPLLVLDLAIPDSAFAAYMRGRGYPARHGSGRLAHDAGGSWTGSFRSAGAHVTVTCTPTGPSAGGPGSQGRQVLVPPAASPADIVRIAFAGHRTRSCAEASPWVLEGDGPLARGIVVEPSSVQFGYEMVGGTYGRPPVR